MLCANCNKESNNQRVCPYCFTPYPTGDAAPSKRQTRRTTGVSGISSVPTPAGVPSVAAQGPIGRFLAFVARQSPIVKFSSAGILLVAVLWIATSPDEGEPVEPGAPGAPVEATPMQRQEADAVIRMTRETALVDVQQDEVFVSYPAATFPLREDGQLALARQFAAADAIVEGRRRRIFFYNPNGKLFAQSDATRGVILLP